MRAFAEIEDILTLHLCALANSSEGQIMMLLGATPFTKKIEIARRFADAHGQSDLKLFDRCFGTAGFLAALTCRNIIAHGVFLGQTDDGLLAFRTIKALNANETSLSVEVVCYEASAFLEVANAHRDDLYSSFFLGGSIMM